MPTNVFEEFLSGVLHPALGLDHLAFVVTLGLLASRRLRGGWIVIAFVVTTLVGIIVHLQVGPFLEADSSMTLAVLLLGLMLVTTRHSSLMGLIVLSAIAGLLYGSSDHYSLNGLGTHPATEIAYLGGLGCVQFAIAMLAMLVGCLISERQSGRFTTWMQWMGFGICTVGTASLKSTFLG